MRVNVTGFSKLFWTLSSLLFLLTVFCSQPSESAKILSISFFSSKSHKITYEKLIFALAQRGHEITYVGPYLSRKNITNLKELQTLDIKTLDKFMVASGNPFEVRQSIMSEVLNTVLNPFLIVANTMAKVCRESYALPVIEEIMKDKYDLIFFSNFLNECLYGLIHKLNASVVLFEPVSTFHWVSGNLGTPSPPSFTPSVFSGFTDQMTYVERLMNFVKVSLTWATLKYYYYPKLETVYREVFNDPTIPSIEEIEKNVSIVLANSHVSITRPKALMPDIIDVGGLHMEPAKPVPKDLDTFISGAGEHGFILFSMGSALKGSMMPENYRKMFLNVFSKLKQRVLWKWETEQMDDLPSNVKLSKWLPQPDVLGDSRCRLFITHGGHGSTIEAMYHGVPLIGMPFRGDQPANMKKAESLGFAIQLEFAALTEEVLLNAINDILTKPQYVQKAKKLSAIYRDQPDKPLDRAIYWVEYVLRHQGAVHLRSAARDLNFIQYFSIDVIATLVLVFVVGLAVNFVILRSLVRKCFGSNRKRNVGGSKKRN